MVLLILFSALSACAILSVIWWCIFIYTNKWIATLIIMGVISISAYLFTSWIIKPTQQGISESMRKSLNL